MSRIRKNFINGLTGLALGFTALALFYIGGCGTDTTNPPTYVDNPNVKPFDSVGVEEDSIMSSFTSMVLLNGTTTTGTAPSRDCSLYGPSIDTLYTKFYLRSGTFANKTDAGFDTKFFLVKADLLPASFDTMSAVYDNIGTALDITDFTQYDTYGTPSDPWGYFSTQSTSHPVYCFWLKGRKDADPNSKNIFGILQPREATDGRPGQAYGFRMSFRIRININGDNDFRKQILQ
jgi:hypothetical protein